MSDRNGPREVKRMARQSGLPAHRTQHLGGRGVGGRVRGFDVTGGVVAGAVKAVGLAILTGKGGAVAGHLAQPNFDSQHPQSIEALANACGSRIREIERGYT